MAPGATLGTAAGIAAAATVAGPAAIVAGAGVGGYTCALLGGLRQVNKEGHPDHEDVRPAEAMVAVNVDGGSIPAEEIVRIFEECGANQVEQAQGTWADGEWKDFDPVSAPRLIGGKDYREHHPEGRPRPSI